MTTTNLKLHLMTMMVATACLLQLCSPGVQGAVWGWILTNPVTSHGIINVEGADRQHSARSVPSGQSNNDEEEQLNDLQRQNHYKHHNRHNHGQIQPCLDDRTCGRGLFCDRHYGMCMPHRHEGEQCRRDNHCDRGYECIFGRCRKSVRTGEKDAKCRNDSDCASGCCARVHGHSICKRLLPVGHRCFVPDGGLDYTLNEVCPCEAGLLCKRFFGSKTKSTSSRDEEISWKPWSENDVYRCAPS